MKLKDLLLENPDGTDPITGEPKDGPDECPMCHADHSDTDPNTTCDYEECGYCGYDHSYEPQQAYEWHQQNDAENSLYDTSKPERDMDEPGVVCSYCPEEAPGRGLTGDAMAAGWVDLGYENMPAWKCPSCQKDSGSEVSARTAPAGRQFESVGSFSFDRFVDDILLTESRRPKVMTAADSPQREVARKAQERPLGRIRFGGKR